MLLLSVLVAQKDDEGHTGSTKKKKLYSQAPQYATQLPKLVLSAQ
jgi:hypothetical protein